VTHTSKCRWALSKWGITIRILLSGLWAWHVLLGNPFCMTMKAGNVPKQKSFMSRPLYRTSYVGAPSRNERPHRSIWISFLACEVNKGPVWTPVICEGGHRSVKNFSPRRCYLKQRLVWCSVQDGENKKTKMSQVGVLRRPALRSKGSRLFKKLDLHKTPLAKSVPCWQPSHVFSFMLEVLNRVILVVV